MRKPTDRETLEIAYWLRRVFSFWGWPSRRQAALHKFLELRDRISNG